ncbi:MAG: antitoxin [Micromonosporaceae bacterium]|nr:antitoxin [Micromonosporaceae bacterium]
MGFKDKFENMKDKGKEAAKQHGDKVDQGLEKGKEIADEKTGGKYSEQIDKGAEKARGHLEENR